MIAFLGRLVRVLLVLLVLRFLVRTWVALTRPRPRPGPPGPRPLVRDPICNTFVPKETALSARVAGKEEHFCSPACRDRALAS